jgi:DnaJ-class molecular chaperone
MDLQDLNPPETYISSYWVDCESCNGYGYTTVSDCCGADAMDGYCVECQEISEITVYDCKDCEGTGQIECVRT